MRHAALFNGIGGFQLAAAWMGWQNIMSCEIDEWCNKVTKFHFPDCIQHGDIKTTDFTIYRGRIDILTGGFPCQPYSEAGRRKGKEDERHLWPWMLRAIKEIQPRWVVGENVRGIITWNGGAVFNEVQADLEDNGYFVLPLLLPACAFGADHRRDRVFFIAHSDSIRQQGGENIAPYTQANKQLERFFPADTWTYLSRPIPYDGKNGVSTKLDGIAFPKWRDKTNHAAGNAIVPGIAYELFKAIEVFTLMQ